MFSLCDFSFLQRKVNKLNKDRQARAECDADAEKMAEELSFLRNQVISLT